ncbi:MAG: hypothetical protein KDJ50_09250 [Alphaproteobacteria bacterium]|nr:hypothetical protein [Alphaproteobacteria bacterium]
MLFDITSDFQVNDSGAILIAFDDPTFVRSETVLLDRDNGHVQVLLQGKLHPVGKVPLELMEMFAENRDVILSSIRIDGSCLELTSRLVVVN